MTKNSLFRTSFSSFPIFPGKSKFRTGRIFNNQKREAEDDGKIRVHFFRRYILWEGKGCRNKGRRKEDRKKGWILFLNEGKGMRGVGAIDLGRNFVCEVDTRARRILIVLFFIFFFLTGEKKAVVI